MIFRVLIPAIGLLAFAAFSPQPIAAAPEPGPSGADLFHQRCQSCHVAPPGQRPILGPTLAGVVGRRAGATEFAYSPALKQSGIIWTKANLDKYLAGPARMVPGTRMTILVGDPEQRAALVEYLASTGG